MPLKMHGVIAIPNGLNSDFDHAAFDPKTRRVFIAHTARDCLEVIDHDAQSHVATLPGFPGVAGSVADEGEILATNRGAATITWLDAVLAEVCESVSHRELGHVPTSPPGSPPTAPRQVHLIPSELFASSRMRAYNRRSLYLNASTSTKNAGDDCRRLG